MKEITYHRARDEGAGAKVLLVSNACGCVTRFTAPAT